MKKLVSLLIVFAILCALGSSALASSSAKGTTIRLEDTSGSVSVLNSSGKAQSVRNDMRLYNGYTVSTGKGSSAYISLDDTKVIKLGASGKVQLKKASNKLEVTLVSGKLYFDVSKPLKTDESLNIRTSTMVTGIRGSSGWVALYEMGMLHGHAVVTCRGPRATETAVYDVYSGERVYYAPGSHPSDFIKTRMSSQDVPLVAIEELRKDPQLQELIKKDVPDLNVMDILANETARRSEEAEQEESYAQQSRLHQEEIVRGRKTPDQVFRPGSSSTQDSGDWPELPAPSAPVSSYTVTFISDGNETVQSVEAGQMVSEPEAPVKEGYDFLGWYASDDAEEEYDFSTPVSEDLTLTARWQAKTYSVTIDPANGDESYTVEVEHGQTVSQPETPSREGYDFAGWQQNGESYDFSSPVTSSSTITAAWSEKVYTVTFDSNGGSDVAPEETQYGQAVSRPADPAREGYELIGWYNGDAEYDFSQAVTSDLTLTARWQVKTYTVTFDTDGGSEVAPAQVEHGRTVSQPETPTREGYDFAGWTVDGESYLFSTPVTSDLTLTAQWQIKTYTVTFDSDGGSDVAAATVEHGRTVARPEDPVLEGYTFMGWNNDQAAYDFSQAVTSDLYLTAQWELNTYTVTFDSDGGSDVDAETVEYGQSATQPDTPTREGYDFLGWYNGQAEYDFSQAVTSDLTLTAQWQIKTYTVTFDSNGGSEVDDATVEHGQTAAQPGDPVMEGYDFTGWYNGQTEYDFSQAVTSDLTLTAQWQIKTYTVTFDSNGGSEVDEATVEHGQTAAQPDDPVMEGYDFTGWYNGQTEYDFSQAVTSDLTLTAQWQIKTYTVTFDSNGGSEVDDATVEHGQTAAEPAEPTRDNYIFSYWYAGDDPDASYDFDTPVTEDLTLTAKWKSTYTVTAPTSGYYSTEVDDNEEYREKADNTYMAPYHEDFVFSLKFDQGYIPGDDFEVTAILESSKAQLEVESAEANDVYTFTVKVNGDAWTGESDTVTITVSGTFYFVVDNAADLEEALDLEDNIALRGGDDAAVELDQITVDNDKTLWIVSGELSVGVLNNNGTVINDGTISIDDTVVSASAPGISNYGTFKNRGRVTGGDRDRFENWDGTVEDENNGIEITVTQNH